MSDHTTEKDARHLNYAYLLGDGTGFFMDCPKCHFFKNAVSDDGSPCRNASCDGTVQRVEFRVIPPASTEATS